MNCCKLCSAEKKNIETYEAFIVMRFVEFCNTFSQLIVKSTELYRWNSIYYEWPYFEHDWIHTHTHHENIGWFRVVRYFRYVIVVVVAKYDRIQFIKHTKCVRFEDFPSMNLLGIIGKKIRTKCYLAALYCKRTFAFLKTFHYFSWLFTTLSHH